MLGSELFATHACALLEHTSSNPVGRWIPAFQRLHYMLGFHNSSYSGGGQDSRGTWFAMYAAWLHFTSFFGGWDIPAREAWAEANEIVENSSVQGAYLRAEAPGGRDLQRTFPRGGDHRPRVEPRRRIDG